MGRHARPEAALEQVELAQARLQAVVLLEMRQACWAEMSEQDKDWWARKAAEWIKIASEVSNV